MRMAHGRCQSVRGRAVATPPLCEGILPLWTHRVPLGTVEGRVYGATAIAALHHRNLTHAGA